MTARRLTEPGALLRHHPEFRDTVGVVRQCSGACASALCDCPPQPAECGTDVGAEPEQRPGPPPYPWGALGTGLLVILLCVLAVHVFCLAFPPRPAP